MEEKYDVNTNPKSDLLTWKNFSNLNFGNFYAFCIQFFQPQKIAKIGGLM